MKNVGLLRVLWLLAVIPAAILWLPISAKEKELPQVAFQRQGRKLIITIGGKRFVEYVWTDNKTTRPYFANVHAPNGLQVTRNHPPQKGDAQDHATMHPGIWLAFGDISGNDYWRNKARVKGGDFLKKPRGGAGRGAFTVRNQYLSKNGKDIVCTEICTYTIVVRPAGYLLISDSRFSSEGGDFYFGDQEEMGLGFRVATPMTVDSKKGGRILDSKGRKNGKGIWGKAAKWCDYSGPVQGKTLGILSMPDPKNFRPAWWHARDYGLLAANPFGRNALTGGKKSKIIVRKGEVFRLRFALLIHSGVEPTLAFLERAYGDDVELMERKKE